MRPTRETTRSSGYAYFVSTQTAGRKPFFRHERWARLMLATINHYKGTGYQLHAFVIMPDHLHVLITPVESVEKSVQLIKGGFSFRAKKGLEWIGEIWQQGFTDHRIRDEEDWSRHLEYIRTNPIEARLVEDIALYEFMGFPNTEIPRGLKPEVVVTSNVRAEARTLQAGVCTFQADSTSAVVATADVRAEARTLQAEARTLQAEAVPFRAFTSDEFQEVEKANAT